MSPRTTKPELAAARDEPPGLVGRATALLRLARRVHLHEHRGVGRVLRDLLRQLDPVDRLPQRDVRGDQSHLVRLQAADEVPSHGRSLRGVELVGLRPQVLGVVLAQLDQPRTQRAADGVDAEPLGDRDERDGLGVATGPRDAVAEPIDAFGERVGHGSVSQTTIAWRSRSPRARCDQ